MLQEDLLQNLKKEKIKKINLKVNIKTTKEDL